MKQSLDKSLAQTNQLHKDVQTLKTASLERDNTIKGLEDQINFMNTKITTMDNQINDLEQYGRNSSVRIYGYALAEHTDTIKAVIQLFNGLNINLQPSEIVAAHPLPMRQYQDRPHISPIIMKFLRNSDKDRVIMARKSLKGRTVSIHNDLTLKNKQFLNRVRNVCHTECTLLSGHTWLPTYNYAITNSITSIHSFLSGVVLLHNVLLI